MASERMYGFGKGLTSTILGFVSQIFAGFSSGIGLGAVTELKAALSRPGAYIDKPEIIQGMIDSINVTAVISIICIAVSAVFAILAIVTYVKRVKEFEPKPVATLVLGIVGAVLALASILFIPGAFGYAAELAAMIA